MGMGLLLGLQIGVTFSEIRGYTFGVFGGRIEGGEKDGFKGSGGGNYPFVILVKWA